jgi:soluble lytic murein transglycosylase-like protein
MSPASVDTAEQTPRVASGAAPASEVSLDGGRTLPDVEAEATADELAPVERPRVPEKWHRRILAVQASVSEAAIAHGVDSDLINAVIWVESKFDPRARGPAGAQGLMQIMPKTGRSLAKRLGRSHRPYDPSFSVDAGTHMLKRMLERFEGDERLALAGYNRGAGTVRGWLRDGKPMPESTEGYVRRVQTARRWLPALIAELEARPRALPAVARR